MANNFSEINNGLIYGKKVLLSIIALAAKEITGVHSLHPKGVIARISGDNIDVDAYINIIYGYTVSDVAFRVQENIKRSVETMTTYKINAVNVSVTGINFEGVEEH